MDPTLYKTAMEGNIKGDGDFKLADHLQRDEENGYQVTAAKGNTVLHVAAFYGQSGFVEEVLKISPALLCYQNRKNETALHVAAIEGHAEVVRVLLSKAGEEKEKLMRMAANNGDTALHKAVSGGHLDAATILVKEEDPEFEHPTNMAGETPLYQAAKFGFHDIVLEILESCKKPNYAASGPSSHTPLHAAVIQGYTGTARLLCEWNKSLCEEADKWGWNSLHYAVKLGLKGVVHDMLRWKKSLAYVPAGSDNDWTTAFHIAAGAGRVFMIKYVLSKYCPDWWEMLNSSGQNVLHVAISNNQEKVIKFLLKSKACHSLVNELDNDGNTPIHLLAVSRNYLPVEVMWHPRAKKVILNKENQTQIDIASSSTKSSKKVTLEDDLGSIDLLGRRDSKPKSGYEKRIDSLMKATQMQQVMATLLMTVTFAAGFTLPGGFDNDDGPNKGMAILTRKAAFRAFVVTDAIAFILSACVIFSYFLMANTASFRKPSGRFFRILSRLYRASNVCQFFALTSVVIAFVTGMYATLTHSVGLAVTVCIIGCLYFFFALENYCRVRGSFVYL